MKQDFTNPASRTASNIPIVLTDLLLLDLLMLKILDTALFCSTEALLWVYEVQSDNKQ